MTQWRREIQQDRNLQDGRNPPKAVSWIGWKKESWVLDWMARPGWEGENCR